GKGRGTELLQYVETDLRDCDQRLILIETSGVGSFEPTRTFYRKNGYDEEARIRDFYNKGDDKIVFRKALELLEQFR
ncbi:MAG: GNAT family N-acetyltransferase, partial [Phormidesmis sp.]